MGINLQKGQEIDLTNGDTGFRAVMVASGWDEVQYGGRRFRLEAERLDCDTSVIICGADGKLVSRDINQSCIFYGNLHHPSGAIVHQGDLIGCGTTDDDWIMIDFTKMPPQIHKMVFVVNIYDANVRNQHLGMIHNVYIRLFEMGERSEGEICRFDLPENYNGMTGLIFAEIYKCNGEWKFKAVGQPVKEASRLNSIIDMYT